MSPVLNRRSTIRTGSDVHVAKTDNPEAAYVAKRGCILKAHREGPGNRGAGTPVSVIDPGQKSIMTALQTLKTEYLPNIDQIAA